MGEPGGSGPVGPYPPGVEGPEAEEEYDLYLRQLRGEAYIENRLTEQAEPAADSTTTG